MLQSIICAVNLAPSSVSIIATGKGVCFAKASAAMCITVYVIILPVPFKVIISDFFVFDSGLMYLVGSDTKPSLNF